MVVVAVVIFGVVVVVSNSVSVVVEVHFNWTPCFLLLMHYNMVIHVLHGHYNPEVACSPSPWHIPQECYHNLRRGRGCWGSLWRTWHLQKLNQRTLMETPWKYIFSESSGVEEYDKMPTRSEELNIPRIWGLFSTKLPSLLNKTAYTEMLWKVGGTTLCRLPKSWSKKPVIDWFVGVKHKFEDSQI